MRVDVEVTRRKFDAELAVVSKQNDILRVWGCSIARVSFPSIDVLFVPRRKLRISVPPVGVDLTSVTAGHQIQLVTGELAMLSARAFGARISLEDYDQLAPSVTFRDAWSWEALKIEQMFRGIHVDDSGKAFNVIPGDHPLTKRPFLCVRGIREYHEHPQHTGDDWMLYRGDFGLFSVISTIQRTCVELAQPNLLILNGQIQLQWEPNPGPH